MSLQDVGTASIHPSQYTTTHMTHMKINISTQTFIVHAKECRVFLKVVNCNMSYVHFFRISTINIDFLRRLVRAMGFIIYGQYGQFSTCGVCIKQNPKEVFYPSNGGQKRAHIFSSIISTYFVQNRLRRPFQYENNTNFSRHSNVPENKSTQQRAQ